VTGAAGFLGRYTSQALANAGWCVHGLGFGSWIDETPESWGLASWTEEEVSVKTLISLTNATSTPDVVIHCAGGSSVALSIAEPGKDLARTVGTLASLLEFVRIYTPHTRIIYPSSAAVYGTATGGQLSEETVIAPCSPYGVHKNMSEELLASYARHFGIDAMTIRFFSLYGVGLRKQLLWDACGKLTDGSFVFDGTGCETRDFLHITDAAQLILTLVESPALIGHRVINGGTGIGTPIVNVLSILANVCNSEIRPSFTGIVRVGDPVHLVANPERALALGWVPRIALTTGLQGYANWYCSISGKSR
jgi:UDP-glucose 4-epimerase